MRNARRGPDVSLQSVHVARRVVAVPATSLLAKRTAASDTPARLR
jgi:hypothetical protein